MEGAAFAFFAFFVPKTASGMADSARRLRLFVLGVVFDGAAEMGDTLVRGRPRRFVDGVMFSVVVCGVVCDGVVNTIGVSGLEYETEDGSERGSVVSSLISSDASSAPSDGLSYHSSFEWGSPLIPS